MAVGPNKLTVSYGTFSCTLEGFDDAFSTMKAVAEYFRELSAEDRYFGAVPPVPDMQMLERLAENEIQRRVEARMAEGGMVLKAGAEPLRTSAFETVPSAPQPAASAPGESVAARLARLRATAARVRGDGETPPRSIFAEDEASGSHAPAPPPGEASGDGTQAEAEAEAAAAEPGPEAAPEAPEAPTRPAAPTAPEPVAAAEAEAEPPAEDDEAKPDAAAEVPPEPEAATAATSAEAEAGPAPAPTQQPAPAPAPAETGAGWAPPQAPAEERTPGPGAAAAGPTHADTGTGWTPPADVEPEEAPEAETERKAPAAAMQDEVELGNGTDEAIERFLAEPEAETPGADTDAAAAAPPEQPREAPHEAPAAELEKPQGPMLLTRQVVGPAPQGEVENQLRVFMNRLRTANRAVTEAEPAAPGVAPTPAARPEAPRETAAAPAPKEAAPSSAEPPLAADEPEAEPAAPETQQPVEAKGRQEAGDEESLSRDLDRLMETAKSQLEVEDHKRRIDAMSHLKAAVAATEAERQLSAGEEGGREADEELDRYREDLSRLVQAQRKTAAAAEPPRRREEAPAGRVMPLVLASEQRVDRALGQGLAAGPGAGVPERMAGATSAYLAAEHDEAEEEPGGDPPRQPSMAFAEFVANLGAGGLGEVMEAAAAYLAVQEGREFFSRPQIMRKLALVVGEDDYTREDGLRAFGALLREGRITKLHRGRFTISKTSLYIDKARGLTH